ncbi:MAG: hypothetical protein OK455_03910 [Thaumarchaeota archaeon]|nr:hypothetical protein [Nitrososphaerota archaeon]
MPTTAVSSLISDAVYLISIVVLSVFLARPVYLVYGAAQTRGADMVASGVGTMLDSISPGTSVITSFESYPGVQLSVVLSGTSVTASFGKSAATFHERWPLQNVVLTPGESYNFSFRGGEIVVAPVRHG